MRRSSRSRAIRNTLLVVLALNLTVAVAKLIVGIVTGSLAILSDGLNSLFDASANVVGLVGMAVATRPPDPEHPYGHRRFEALTALVIAGAMGLLVVQILQEAWQRLHAGAHPEATPLSFAVMTATLLVNVGVSTWERRRGQELRSPILSADAKHTAADALVSLAVIAGLVAVRLGYPLVDPLLAIGIAGVIGWGAWTIIRDAALTLSDTAVVPVEVIECAVLAVPGVRGVHNVRTRGGDGLVWVDLHIQVDPELSVRAAHDIASTVARAVEDTIGQSADVTVHVEPALPEHLRATRGYRAWME
ncbi:MAG: cation diffusion facilitator family transporter [Thermomicrobium sp.]|nr:cation diffusion facilitator family transporter [Thermomicrobium sp.]MDW8059112.1 cation diffusion facilitator family transporter [Thermomicrobium sp.]